MLVAASEGAVSPFAAFISPAAAFTAAGAARAVLDATLDVACGTGSDTFNTLSTLPASSSTSTFPFTCALRLADDLEGVFGSTGAASLVLMSGREGMSKVKVKAKQGDQES